MFFARPFLALGLVGLLAAAGTGSIDANAQQIYRIVGSDGRVTFSDKPPLASNAKATTAAVARTSNGAALGGLPFELRQVANRFPVTLYTAPSCAPCLSGRAMLASRGIPFAEKTVTTNEDIDALKRLAGAPSLPLLTIGGQQLKGFAEVEWSQFLDAAGYPKTSQLPSGYSQVPPAPLVAAQEPLQATARAPAGSPADQPPTASAPEPAPSNPTGIRF
jgi:glutaredoxin